MKWEQFFSGLIKAAFLFAFAAFLWASIHHLATFYANFEPRGTDESGPYALAISIDGTALVLTIGIMFFARSMPRRAKVIVWIFILALTAFSWSANWEYATRFQQTSLTSDPFLTELNPILASSFAFLNIVYAVVSEFFSLRIKTVEELKKELAETDERLSLEKQLSERKNQDKKSPITWIKETAIEAKTAFSEVRESGTNMPSTLPPVMPNSGQSETQTRPQSGQSDDNLRTEQDQNAGQNETTVMPKEGQSEAAMPDEMRPEEGQTETLAKKVRSQKTVSFEEAMQATGLTRRQLQNKIERGLISVSRKNRNRVEIDGLGRWITVSRQPQKETAQPPVLQLVTSSNGHHSYSKNEDNLSSS